MYAEPSLDSIARDFELGESDEVRDGRVSRTEVKGGERKLRMEQMRIRVKEVGW